MAKRDQKEASLLVLVAMVVVMVVLAVQVKSVVAAGEYTEAMMKVVREQVNAVNFTGNDARPGLIRLMFHDCFVNGCDGSVLLMTSRESSADGTTEKDSGFNIGLRGFEVIDKIKEKLADYKVTCTDAVIYAAREAVYLLSNGKIAYNVDGPGRKDGVISRSEDPEKYLPTPSSDFAVLVKKFTDKVVFTEKDVVALSGAHAVGVAHSTTINVTGTPEMYQTAVGWETFKDPNAVKNNVREYDGGPLKISSGYKDDNKERMAAKGVLDNSFYNAVLQKMALFPSDRVLGVNAVTKVREYMNNAGTWNNDFGSAMEKLSKLRATSDPSKIEIRNVCSKTN
ncbi:hypothetical protein CFC21_005607 [Triticum aestivum]|uniref:Peroxidase n=2 Tax=Triticum aestivum TaxID=4565 RepID=A0A9R1IPK2_WHEAT|nr:cationic peroxidase 1-like [Triticum aestivum]KAF6988022.1 hypothetical protein CFC21_005607 [Triticum aestivum]